MNDISKNTTEETQSTQPAFEKGEHQEDTQTKETISSLAEAKDILNPSEKSDTEMTKEEEQKYQRKVLKETYTGRLPTIAVKELQKVVEAKMEKLKQTIEEAEKRLKNSKEIKDDEPILTEEEFEKLQEDFTDRYTDLIRLVDSYTDQLTTSRDCLTIVEKNNQKLLNKAINETVNPTDKFIELDIDNIDPGKLKPEDFKIVVLAEEHDLIKVTLLNSGFNVVLRDLTLGKLDTIFNRLYTETETYSKQFGAFFYLYNDLFIKQTLLEELKSNIQSCTLKNWRKGNRFLEHLSIHDYDVLLHGFGRLMYPEGFPYKYECSYPDCDHHEEFKIDLGDCKYFNYDLIPEELIIQATSKEICTTKRYNTYHASLNLKKSISVGKRYILNLQVPTMQHFLSYGKEFNKVMLKCVTEDDITATQRYLQYNYAKIFYPWVSSIDVLNKEGQIKLHITDKETIITILDTIHKKDIESLKEIEKFIKSTKITHICYPVNPCPECHKLPSNAVNGFLPFDVQSSFFSQCLMYLLTQI